MKVFIRESFSVTSFSRSLAVHEKLWSVFTLRRKVFSFGVVGSDVGSKEREDSVQISVEGLIVIVLRRIGSLSIALL